MIPFETLKAWFVSLGFDAATIYQGPYVQEMPDKIITITMLSGTGYALEGATDGPAFQTRVRGSAWDQDGPEAVAKQLDDALFAAIPPPAKIGGTVIQLVDRIGGGPSPLGMPDDGDRFEYVCTYRLSVSNPIVSVS